MITLSNGYHIRKLKISDYTFMCETLEDFPLGSLNMNQVQNEMASMLNLQKSFGTLMEEQWLCTILEFKGVPVSFRFTRFLEKHWEVRMEAVHPEYRGQGHHSASNFIHGPLFYDILGMETGSADIVAEGGINLALTNIRAKINTVEDSRLSREDLGSKKLNRFKITKAQWIAWKSSHSIYKDVTWTS